MLVPIGYNNNEYECVDTSKPAKDNRCTATRQAVENQSLNDVESKVMSIALKDLATNGNCCRPLYTTTDLSFNKFGWALKIDETLSYKTEIEPKHNVITTAIMDTKFIDRRICHCLGRVDYSTCLLFGGTDKSTGFPFIVIGNIDGSMQLLPFTDGSEMFDSSALHILMGVMRGQVSGAEFERMKSKMDTTVYVSMTPSEVVNVEDTFISYMENNSLLPSKNYADVCTLMRVLLKLGTENGQEWVAVMVYLLLCDTLHRKITKLKWLSYMVDLELLALKRQRTGDQFEFGDGLSLFGIQDVSRLICDDKNNLITIHLAKDDSVLFETKHIALINLCGLNSLKAGSLVKSKVILYRLNSSVKMAKEPAGGYFESPDPLLINSALNFVLEPDDDLDIISEINKKPALCGAGITLYADYDRWLRSGRLDELLYWIFDNAVSLTQYKSRNSHSSLCITIAQCIPEVDGVLKFKEVHEAIKHVIVFPRCMSFYELVSYSMAVSADEDIKQDVRLRMVKAFVDSLELVKYNGAEYTTNVAIVDREENVHLYVKNMGKCDLAIDCNVILLKNYTESMTGFALLFENHLYNMAGLVGRLNRLLEVVDAYDMTGDSVEKSYTMLYNVVHQIVNKLIAEGLITYNEIGCLDVSQFSSKVADYVRAGHTAIKYKSPDFKWLQEYCDTLIHEYCAELF